jgi:hypothetical protein
MSDNQEFMFWYYNRVNEFSNALLASMHKELNEPTINDLKKNEVEANG